MLSASSLPDCYFFFLGPRQEEGKRAKPEEKLRRWIDDAKVMIRIAKRGR